MIDKNIKKIYIHIVKNKYSLIKNNLFIFLYNNDKLLGEFFIFDGIIESEGSFWLNYY